jgi:hypothetical protein
MANRLEFFMAPEDEVALFRFLERLHLEVYPRRIPPDWKPFRAGPETVDQLPEEEAYLAASEIGAVLVDKLKRGPDKGFWRVDEVRSPVVFYARSRKDEEGQLLPGLMWAELEITPQTGRRDPAPDKFRRLFLEIEGFMKKTFRKSEPAGFWVGPAAARLTKEGLVLFDPEKHKPVRPFR